MTSFGVYTNGATTNGINNKTRDPLFLSPLVCSIQSKQLSGGICGDDRHHNLGILQYIFNDNKQDKIMAEATNELFALVLDDQKAYEYMKTFPGFAIKDAYWFQWFQTIFLLRIEKQAGMGQEN